MKHKQTCLVMIGRNLKTCRKSRGFSQEEIAFRSDLALSYYGRVERGEQNPSLIIFLRIVLALDAELQDIIPTIKTLPLNIITDN